MNTGLDAWNKAQESSAFAEMIACCGAKRWAMAMVASRPILNTEALRAEADKIWNRMDESDWLEAFACHPRIGERNATPHASAQSTAWSRQEQAQTTTGDQGTLARLAEGNKLYEERFGFTYIVCATGKGIAEMLAILERRLQNDHATELREAAEQQRQIMQIRLGKWLKK